MNGSYVYYTTTLPGDSPRFSHILLQISFPLLAPRGKDRVPPSSSCCCVLQSNVYWRLQRGGEGSQVLLLLLFPPPARSIGMGSSSSSSNLPCSKKERVSPSPGGPKKGLGWKKKRRRFKAGDWTRRGGHHRMERGEEGKRGRWNGNVAASWLLFGHTVP